MSFALHTHSLTDEGLSECASHILSTPKQSVTTQDILSLTNAYAAIRQNSDRGSGYKLKEDYSNDILKALNLATLRYIKQLEANQ